MEYKRLGRGVLDLLIITGVLAVCLADSPNPDGDNPRCMVVQVGYPSEQNYQNGGVTRGLIESDFESRAIQISTHGQYLSAVKLSQVDSEGVTQVVFEAACPPECAACLPDSIFIFGEGEAPAENIKDGTYISRTSLGEPADPKCAPQIKTDKLVGNYDDTVTISLKDKFNLKYEFDVYNYLEDRCQSQEWSRALEFYAPSIPDPTGQ